MSSVQPSASEPPMTEFEKMNDFMRLHQKAGQFLMLAVEDYAAARCLSQNLLISSLIVGAQAIEKFLKAFLLMADPSQDVKRLGHNLTNLLKKVDQIAPHLSLLNFLPLIDRFGGHYLTRYPDNPGASQSMTTADMVTLDELILLINENLPCPQTVRYRTGLYAMVTFSVTHQGQVHPTGHWIRHGNHALAPLLPRIEQDQVAVLGRIHPGWQP